MNKLVEKYKALGCEVRMRIVLLLLNHEEGLYVCDLTSILQLPQYNISKHLSTLKKASLVIEKREGKRVLYKINSQPENDEILMQLKNLDYRKHRKFKKDLERMNEVFKNGSGKCDT